MSEFERKNRYLVIKRSDLRQAINIANKDAVNGLEAILGLIEWTRGARGKSEISCVVVEHDWPEYEQVWKMIENRTKNNNLENDMSEIKNYRKKTIQAMRPYIVGEDLTGVSVSVEDAPEEGGMIAIGADNDARWYVSRQFFNDNYELVG